MEDKKLRELKYACYFVERINNKYATDYEAVSNTNESRTDEYIDVYANSLTLSELGLQITSGQPELKEIFPKLRKEARMNGQGYAIGEGLTLSVRGLVENALRRKNYDPALMGKIILLIEHEYGVSFDGDYVKRIFGDFTNTAYKGLYIVMLPTTIETSSHPQPGQIVAIKNTFGENCVVF